MPLDARNNVFQIFAGLKRVPFAVSRRNYLTKEMCIRVVQSPVHIGIL